MPDNVAPPEDVSPAQPHGGSAFDPLRHPLFRNVWIANLASNFGVLIQVVAASWMMMAMTHSAEMVALVQTSSALPIMFLSLAAGAIADNYDRRLVMLASQAFMLLVSAVLAAVTWFGVLTPWLLLSCTFLIGCGMAFNGPAWQASVSEMVPRHVLTGAVTLNSMGFNLARAVGPAIGGIIVAALGAATAFVINAVSYVGLLVVLIRWRSVRAPRLLPPERIDLAMSAGIRYVAMSPSISSVLARSALFGIGSSAVLALMPLVARDLIGGGPSIYGLLLGAFGVGGVVGGLSGRRLRQGASNEMLVRWTAIAFAVAALVVGLSHWLVLTMAALIVGGAAWVLVLSSLNVTVQMAGPRWVVGRALSLYRMAMFAGIAAGSWLWGLITQAQGVGLALGISALVLLACAVAGLRFPLVNADDLNLDPLERWTEPAIAVAVEPRSGPIVITIEYRIRTDDILEFLAAMAERRRVRLRDGARHWTLLRDLGDPELWIERYHTPTWNEYVRHNHRRTHADAAVSERIRALHQGSAGPVVHRMIERQTGSLPRRPAG